MDAEKLRDICIKSCKAYYNYVKKSGKGRDEIKTSYLLPKDNAISLKLFSKLWSLDGLIINIDGMDYPESDVHIRSYNEISNQLVIVPSPRILKLLSDLNEHEVKVITDLSWLILSAKKYFESYGNRIAYPKTQPVFHKKDCVFPEGYTILPDQEYAIRTSLNNKLSYIWGAPGTGKTQCVLTTCVMTYVLQGKRVAIVAPTNNALDHVLKSVINEISSNYSSFRIDLQKDIVRLGTATADFFNEYPLMCTSNTVSKQLAFKRKTLMDLCNTRDKLTAETLRPAFIALCSLVRDVERSDDQKKICLLNYIIESFSSIKEQAVKICDCGYLFEDVDEFNVCARINQTTQLLYGQEGYGVQGEYSDKSLNAIEQWIKEYENKIVEMETSKKGVDIDNAKVLAMTPQTMMLLFGPDDLKIDHIFLDEANYSSVINILPLFVFGAPITMCGDHMQLPPVCVINKDEITTAIDGRTDEKYCMLWSMNVLYAESFLFQDLGQIVQGYIDNKPPPFNITAQVNLTTSYRFGNNLAKVLDKNVYKNGISGVAPDPIKVIVINAVSPDNGNNENEAEAEAIYKTILSKDLKKEDYAILTPYKNQVKQLKNHPLKSKLKYSPNIMTIHASEGKEWDTVIISVVDDRPGKLLTCTSKKDGPGLNTINTAVSRAKKRLVLVCNEEFWSHRENELITDLIMNSRLSVL